jgi:hypothetical protein
VTVVADAGMISAANQQAIEDAKLSFILGTKIPEIPYVVKAWRKNHEGEQIPDGHVFVQPWPATQVEKDRGKRDRVIYYQYRADRARRTLRGIDEQVGKAEKAVAGKVAVKRNRFIQLAGGTKSVNRELEAKAPWSGGLVRRGAFSLISSVTAVLAMAVSLFLLRQGQVDRRDLSTTESAGSRNK